MKTYPLAHVLSITTSRLCTDIGDVYEILNHVTGDNLFTHVLPRACRFAAPLILAQNPELAVAGTDEEMAKLVAAIAAAKTPMDGVRAWLATLPLRADYEIASHADAWLSLDPMSEAVGMFGRDKEKASSLAAPLLSELEADLRIAQIERRTSWIDRVDATPWEMEAKRLEEAIASKRGHSDNDDQAQAQPPTATLERKKDNR